MGTTVIFKWTPGLVLELRKHVDAGKTAREIAHAMATTRNTIIGKCRRMRFVLLHRPRTANVPLPESEARPVKTVPEKPQHRPIAPSPIRVIQQESAFVARPTDSPIAFAELRAFISQCRWPLHCDDGETRYCGKAVFDAPYCQVHARRAFNSSSHGKPRSDLKPIGIRRERAA